MKLNDAIKLAESVADLLEFDPMTGGKVSEYRMEYQQAQAIRVVLCELKRLRWKQKMEAQSDENKL